MEFGTHTKPAEPADAGGWIASALTGSWGTVGALIPDQYSAVLRVSAPESDVVDWWDAYRNLFAAVTTIGEQYTSTPEQTLFAVWEGHGYDETTESLRRTPRLELPNRSYYLLSGHVTAATKITYPGWDGWRNPDLFWPQDRRWFVATDVDFWSLYIAADQDFIAELAGTVQTESEPVHLDQQLSIEN